MTDLSHMTYAELLDSLRKDLQLDLGSDALPNTFPVVSGLLKWITPTLLNSWANQGSSFDTAGYLKDPLGFVHLKGVVTGGASGTAAFVLPVGYRPGGQTVDPGGNVDVVGSAPTAVRIDTSGGVTIQCGTNNSFVGLSSITFLAEN